MKKKILIVEDDASTLELLSILVSMSGYQVRVEKDGLRTLDIVKEYHPNLILLDAVLPGLDGYSIQKQLHEDAGTKNIPIILMTAHAELDQVFVGKVNIADFIIKPFSLDMLRDKINKILEPGKGK